MENPNFFAIVIAALINMILGAIWYAPKVFGNAWIALTGMTEEKQKNGAGKAMGWAVVASLVTAFVMSYILQFVRRAFPGVPLSFMNGAWLGFYLWLGFTGAVMFSNYQFNQQPNKLAAIDIGYPLVSLVIMGGMLAVWVN
jgi:hypothetical protein